MTDNAFIDGFDYYQYGLTYCELYTYDKAWNDSSVEDTQQITGINNNNYWINKYGPDFIPYRGIGWKDENWRRPNQKGTGGTSVGEEGSSPLDYTNGSHPRVVYLGNRFISVCRHCCIKCGSANIIENYYGSIPNKVVFVGPEGTTHEYQIENYVNLSNLVGTSGGDQSMIYRFDGTTSGPGPCNAYGRLATDGLIMRLTTDPADDGIPAIKKFIDMPSVGDDKTARMLVYHGYGILLPYCVYGTGGVYGAILTSLKGFSPLGGNYIKQVWSGHSGTHLFLQDYKSKRWLFAIPPMASTSINDYTIEKIKTLTGDDEYEIVTSYEEWPYYPLENIPDGSTGASGGTYLLNHEISANINAETVSDNYSLESNKLLITDRFGVDAPTFRSGFDLYLKDVYGSSPDVNNNFPTTEGLTLYYANNPSGYSNQLITNITDSDIEYNGNEDDLSYFVLFQNNDIPISIEFPPTSSTYSTTFTDEFSGINGETELTFRVSSPDGFDDITKTFYIRGFTSGTSSVGLTYDSVRNKVKYLITDGTVLEEPDLPGQYTYQFETYWSNPPHRQSHGVSTTNEVVLDPNTYVALQGRTGQTFDIFVKTRSSITQNDAFIAEISISDAGPFNP